MTGLRLLVETVRREPAQSNVARAEDAWSERFSDRLRDLRPMLSLLARHQKARAAFQFASHVDPEVAATIWGSAPVPPLTKIVGRSPQRRPRVPVEPGAWALRFAVAVRELTPTIEWKVARTAALLALAHDDRVDPVQAASIYARNESVSCSAKPAE